MDSLCCQWLNHCEHVRWSICAWWGFAPTFLPIRSQVRHLSFFSRWGFAQIRLTPIFRIWDLGFSSSFLSPVEMRKLWQSIQDWIHPKVDTLDKRLVPRTPFPPLVELMESPIGILDEIAPFLWPQPEVGPWLGWLWFATAKRDCGVPGNWRLPLHPPPYLLPFAHLDSHVYICTNWVSPNRAKFHEIAILFQWKTQSPLGR